MASNEMTRRAFINRTGSLLACATLPDSIKILQFLIGKNPIGSFRDINQNKKADLGDAIGSLQESAGLIGSPEIPFLYSTTHNISQSSNNPNITMVWEIPCRIPEGYVYVFNNIPNHFLSVGKWTDSESITENLEAGTHYFHVAPAYNCSPECSLGPIKHFGPLIIRN